MVWAEQESATVLRRLWAAQGPPPVEANVVFKVDNYSFYVNTVDHRDGKLVLGGVSVWERPVAGGYPTYTTAESAVEENDVWVLKNGSTILVKRDGDVEVVCHFRKMKLDLRRSLADYLAESRKTPKGMSLGELREQMKLLDRTGLKTDQFKLEYGFKLAIPLSSVVLMLCVAPLSMRFGRGGGFMGVLIGIVVLFFYWNVILFSRVLGETGGLSPALAGWSEVIVFGVMGAVLMWKSE
jgi:lipopolysaccharide export system permease protein